MFPSLIRVCCLFVLVIACACSSEATTAPVSSLAQGTSTPSPYRESAFIVDVSTLRRRVAVSAPTVLLAGLPASSSAVTFGARVQPSLLGGDAVEMRASNYAAGVLGATVPGKVLVTFDLTIINRLAGLRLITPTFPAPPSNVVGVQAFPIEVAVLSTAGGVSVTGGVITVSSPRSGLAVPSGDWDGAPHNFFNDVGCGDRATDCFRYEPFGTLEPLAASPPRRVGFLVDPSVGDLRVRIIVAADLQAASR